MTSSARPVSSAPPRGPAAEVPDPWHIGGWLMGCLWLGFLTFPIVALQESAADAGWISLGWFSLVAFALAYVGFLFLAMRRGWAVITPIEVIGLVVLVLTAAATVPALGAEAFGLAPFVMSYAAFGLNWKWQLGVSGTMVALVTTVAVLWPDQMPPVLVVIVITLALAVAAITWLISRSVGAEVLRTSLAVSHERESVARDVHDVLGHSLTVVRLKAQLAERVIDSDPDRARAELREIVSLTGEAISAVRSTVTGLRASSLAEQVPQCVRAMEGAGIAVSVDGHADGMAPGRSMAAAWILREATTNVLRHARARSVRIVVRPRHVQVSDDGTGVNGAEGNGLRGMRERASAAGARLTISPAAGGGTSVTVEW